MPERGRGGTRGGSLHVLGVVGLQHPLAEPGPAAQEHNDLGDKCWGQAEAGAPEAPGELVDRQAHLGKGDRGHKHGAGSCGAGRNTSGGPPRGRISQPRSARTACRHPGPLIQQPVPRQCPLSVGDGPLQLLEPAADLGGAQA